MQAQRKSLKLFQEIKGFKRKWTTKQLPILTKNEVCFTGKELIFIKKSFSASFCWNFVISPCRRGQALGGFCQRISESSDLLNGFFLLLKFWHFVWNAFAYFCLMFLMFIPLTDSLYDFYISVVFYALRQTYSVFLLFC